MYINLKQYFPSHLIQHSGNGYGRIMRNIFGPDIGPDIGPETVRYKYRCGVLRVNTLTLNQLIGVKCRSLKSVKCGGRVTL